MSKLELLAPAGDFECLKAAVQSGADAVYFAGKSFGARNFAKNFSDDEIKKAIDYCKVRGVKSHITINTAYTDNEIFKVLEFVNFLYKEGADAIILSDPGLIYLIKKYFPDFPVHFSTQMTLHNLDGVNFARDLGADRVVLSRELPFKEIEHICKNSSLAIEIFVHGALCMSYSGQCLLSSMIGGRSGNRGSCAQPCRLPFGDRDNKKFILSLKDLSLIEEIEKIKKLGVCSLKIEGRMKGASYVSAIVSVYRKYLDYKTNLLDKDIKILESVFNRGGLTSGYFSDKKGKEMFCFSKPDNPYLKQDKDLLKGFEINFENEENKKIDIECDFVAKENEYIKITLKNKEHFVTLNSGFMPETANNKAISREDVKLQLLKTGGTPFNISRLNIEIDDNIFIRKSLLNELRRNAIAKFEEKIILNNKRVSTFSSVSEKPENIKQSFCFTAFVSTKEQLFSTIKYNALKRFYVPIEFVDDIVTLDNSIKEKIVITLPEIVFDSELLVLEKHIKKAKNYGFMTLLIHNPSQLKYKNDFSLVLSQRFNIWNSYSLLMYKEYNPEALFLSPELNLKQIKALKKPTQCEYIVYGNIPVMITENCIIKNNNSCPCDGSFKYITDRMGAEFPVKKVWNSCRTVLYNSVPIYLADKKDDILNMGCIGNLYFTKETGQDVEKIINEYLNGSLKLPESFTRGHFYK